MAVVPMPEAAMNKYYLSSFTEYEVWLARQLGNMQPIPVSHAMNETTD